jgi:hypothetical protein
MFLQRVEAMTCSPQRFFLFAEHERKDEEKKKIPMKDDPL